MKDPNVSALLRRQQLVLQHGLPLGSYLLKPVQRILKYHVMLQVSYPEHLDRSQCDHGGLIKVLNVAEFDEVASSSRPGMTSLCNDAG